MVTVRCRMRPTGCLPCRTRKRFGSTRGRRPRPFTARIVAVTGSVGKTGTKEALATLLGAQGITHASSGISTTKSHAAVIGAHAGRDAFGVSRSA